MLGPAVTAVPSTTVTISVYFLSETFNINAGNIYIEYTKSGGGTGDLSTGFTATAGTTTRISITGLLPSNVLTFYLVIDGVNAAVTPANFSGLLYEYVGSVDTYFDGDTASASWDGADGNSSSTLSSGSAVNVADPDAAAGTVRWRSATEAVVFGVAVADAPQNARIRGTSETVAIGVLAAVDAPAPTRQRSAEGAGVSTGVLAAADTPTIMRWISGAESGSSGVTIVDAPSLIRWRSADGSGAAFGVAVPDAPLLSRLLAPYAAVASGVVVADAPGLSRWRSATESGTTGPVNIADIPGLFRIISPGGVAVISQPTDLAPVVAPVRRILATADVDRLGIVAPVREVLV
jgi:hypothetical protein